jgi:ABC-2 type transport system ATP-binding protein
VIEVVHVSKSFGRVKALRDVCLSIEEGERVAFVGSNGSGKTTLLRSILGLLRIDGRISIAGVDVAKSPELALGSVAYMPQIAPPLEAPVQDLVRAICRLRGLEAKSVESRAARLGLTLGEVADVRLRDLSGGTKQKLLAALTLAAEAPILICDEPTANLDAQSRAAFFAELDARPKHHVTVLCSHRIDEVRQLVDRVVELEEGRVKRDASVDELLADRQRFRIEVSLAKTAGDVVRVFLLEHGFVAAGAVRFETLVTQSDKVAIVARLVREHGTAISDLSVYHVDDLELTERVSSPQLVGGTK